MGETPSDSLRLDIWLWRARFIKTRAEAARFIGKGKVRLMRAGESRRITKSHFKVRAGDRVTFMRAENLVDVEVIAIGTRRGPYSEALELYAECGVRGGSEAS